MRPDTAIVLAGGKGTRMRRPDLPKPLVPVGGRPMLDRVLDGLAEHGYSQVALVVGHLHELIEDHVGSDWRGMQVRYAFQAEQRGTADAVACAAAVLDPAAPALLTWADILVAPVWYGFLADAWAQRADRQGLAVLTTAIEGDPSVGAGVGFDDDWLMTSFVEKPAGVTRGWADGGVSIHAPQSLAMMPEVAPSERGELEVASVLAALLADGVPIGVECYTGPWCDLGTPELVAAAEARFQDLLA